MKFKATSYHLNLLRDSERLAVFKEAIEEFGNSLNASDSKVVSDFSSNSSDFSSDFISDSSFDYKVAFDLGCGSGILSYFAKDFFDKIIAIDINPKIIKYTKENLKEFNNIEVFNNDVIDFDFQDKADLIICEMLDTALIDEEEVPVLNYVKEFLKDDGKIIPQGIINSAELIYMKSPYIQYEDDKNNPEYTVLSNAVIYSEFDFLDDIDTNFSANIRFDLFGEGNNKYVVNGIKLTSFTKLNDNLISGPSPMLNPCLLIPIDEVNVESGGSLEINLSYVMGQGIETIKTKIIN